MILETFVVLNTSVLATKMIYKPVVDYHDTYNKVVNEGLYHITSKENATAILESDSLNPSGYVNSLGSKKVFFFAGIPTLEELSTNAAFELTNETLYAIKIKPTYDEMASFKTRVYNDKAIAYEGEYKLNKDNSERVELIYDFNKDHNIIIREKNEAEYLQYEQPKEIKDKLCLKSKLMTTLKGMGVSYLREFKALGELVKNKSYVLMKNISNRDTIDRLKEERDNLLSDQVGMSR